MVQRQVDDVTGIGPDSMFPPIANRPTAWQLIVERLMYLISNGKLTPGEKLPGENELAKAMNVSRPVVREALSALSTMGIIESRKGGGSYITDLSPERLMAPLTFLLTLSNHNMSALFRAREVVEASLAADAASFATDEEIARFRELVAAGYAAKVPLEFRPVDSEFHELVGSAGRNEFLNLMSRSLYTLGLTARTKAIDADPHHSIMKESCKDHDAIVDAIAAHDPDAAAAAMAAHVNRIRDAVEKGVRALHR